MAANDPEQKIEHATRAVELVSIFKSLSSRQNTYLDDGWASMLKVPKSSAEFYTTIGTVSNSLKQLVMEVNSSRLRDASKKLYTDAATELEKYVNVENLRSLTTDHIKKEAETFRLLTLLDDVLEPIASRAVSEKTLNEWDEELTSLIRSASEAIEDKTLLGFVVTQLTSLQWAVRNYDWLGVEGISRTYGAMAAELARSQSMKGAQTDKARSWHQRAKKPIIAIGISIAATSALVEQTDKLLTHGGHVYEVLAGKEDDKPADAVT